MNTKPDLVQFQTQVYAHLDNRVNAVIDLLNALSGNTQAGSPQARSVVELSLHPLFGRQYSELLKAIHEFHLSEADRWRLMAPFLPLCPKSNDN